MALTCHGLLAQVVISQSDMPVPGDTLRVSSTNVVPAGYAHAAMDTSWNFSALQALSQQVDTFQTVASTPSAYQLIFVLLGGANLAAPRSGSPIPGIPVSQGFTFYKNSAASFGELGSAFMVQGLPLPAKYDNPDKYYQFPMQPNLTWSSTASFSLDIPNLAYFSTHRYRTNVVDGWGSLTTPYGTFATLRVKSTLLEHDSIYIDSLSTGFPFNRNIIQYKWLGKGKGIPLLEVDEEGTLVSAIYRDHVRMSALPFGVSLGADTSVFLGSTITLTARVTGGTPPFQIVWNTLDTGKTITVNIQKAQTFTAVVVDALQNFASAQKVVSIRYPPGVGELDAVPPAVSPNPTSGPVRIRLSGPARKAVLHLYSPQGKMVRESIEHPVNGEINTSLSGLPGGLYGLRITTGDKVVVLKVVVAD